MEESDGVTAPGTGYLCAELGRLNEHVLDTCELRIAIYGRRSTVQTILADAEARVEKRQGRRGCRVGLGVSLLALSPGHTVCNFMSKCNVPIGDSS
jgi:hypothetical protein